MKLRQRVDDFQVEEITEVRPTGQGRYGLYRLEKRGWTTPDAIAAIRRRWRLERDRISYGGLKDRHAVTVQYLTIRDGPERSLEHQNVRLTYLGRVAERYTSESFRGNRFRIVMRSLSAAQVDHAAKMLAEAEAAGIANYFDDQRFGSVVEGKRFIARDLVRGAFEDALRLALTGWYEHDRAQAKAEKQILRTHWGDWPTCLTLLPKGHARSIVTYLVHHPNDYRGACARLRPDLQGMYLSAWQSYLWNRTLDCWLRDHLSAEQLMPIRLKTGVVVMPRTIPADLRDSWERLIIPLPSARVRFDPAASWAAALQTVLSDEGITLGEMRIRGLQKPFFARGERPARVAIANVVATSDQDDLNRGRLKLTLTFELPRGSYATMIVKRLTSA